MPDQTITVRRAAVRDAAALRGLRLEALQDKPEAFGSDYETEARDSVEHWRAQVKDPQGPAIMLAFAGAKPVGMAGVGRYRHAKMKHNGFVWGVYVQPAWRGRGLCGRLLKACARWARARGLTGLKLGVITANPPAVNSYLRAGFRIYGVDPQVIRCGGVDYDEFLMVLDL